MSDYLRFVVHQAMEVRSHIAVAVALFMVGILVAPLYPGPGLQMAESLTVVAHRLQDSGFFEIALTIFARNTMAVTVSLLLGIGLGLFPAAAALMNGWLAGAVIADSTGSLWLLVPHGLFELPAVFIAWGLGIWCGFWVLSRSPLVTLKARLKVSLWMLVMLVVPLLAMAALIESALIVWIA